MSSNKEKILEMKKKGYSYRSISFILGVPLGTVKATVHFAKIVKPEVVYCKFCGKRVKQPAGKKKKEFCSDKCRGRWWSQHKNLLKHFHPVHKKCPICGKVFSEYSSQKHIYCSRECYEKSRHLDNKVLFPDE